MARSRESRFLGGAVVFPGGKLDASDVLAEWTPLTTPPRAPQATSAEPFTSSDAHLRSLAIAAARETLEEAAILHVAGGSLSHDALLSLRQEIATNPGALRTFLANRRLRLDLDALHPLARWVTPVAESRRFDTRFFVAIAPPEQPGAHDDHETVASRWEAPADVITRFDRGEVQLLPPTHATLAMLAGCATTADVITLAERAALEPVCPKLAPHVDGAGETMALVLPGDPEHDVKTARVPGRSRYVLRGDRWLPEDPPR